MRKTEQSRRRRNREGGSLLCRAFPRPEVEGLRFSDQEDIKMNRKWVIFQEFLDSDLCICKE